MLLGTLAAGLIGSALLLWRSVDIDSLLEASTGEPPPLVHPVAARIDLPEPPTTRPWKAYLYWNRSSAGFFPDPGYYNGLIGAWDALLAELGGTAIRISGAEAMASLGSGDLLVIPSAVCLDADERENVGHHLEAGGHVLASWALGVRDGSCDWVGYDLVAELARAETAGSLEGGAPIFLTVPYGTPFGVGLPPGTRIELRNEPWVTARARASDVFWSDWILNPFPAVGGGSAAAALATVHEGSGGRLAWIGFRLGAGADTDNDRLLRRLIENAVYWASGHAIGDIEPWPGGYRAALAVTVDAEYRFENSRRLAERLAELDVPATFFIVSRLAFDNPELAEIFASVGEVGSHSVDHRQIAGRRFGSQLESLKQAREDVRAWSGRPALGLRPPRETYDWETLEAWRRVGGLYLAGANGARTAAPSVFQVHSGGVVVLPRLVDDDHSVMVLRGRLSSDSLEAALLAGLQKMRSLGGLDLVTLHSQLIESDLRVAAVESAIRTARENGDVWLAHGADIAGWWLRRSALDVRVRERSDGSFVISVRNYGDRPIAGARLRLYLAEVGSAFSAPELSDSILPSSLAPHSLRIELPALKAGESINVLLPKRLG